MITFDLPTSFVLTIGLLNCFLGLTVLFRSAPTAVNRSFGVMTLLVGLWSLAAFFFRATTQTDLSVLLGYTLYASATLLPPAFFVMSLNFPPDMLMTKRVRWLLILETLFVGVVTCIPGLVIHGMHTSGTEKILEWGNYYSIYVLHQMFFFLLGYGVLFRKYRQADKVQRTQLAYIILGTIIPANLALIGNLILPWYGYYGLYTWFGQVCMILIVLFSGYAIWKHNLFDIKVVATEIFILATSATLLIRFFLVSNPADKWIGGIIFLVVAVFGVLLVKSVWREVEQREKLQTLTLKLEDANVQLQALDQARADFITLISHQLRTPPATVKWYLAAVQSGDFGVLPEEAAGAITKAEIANNSLISLIDDLLNASRIERGKMEFLFEPVSLTELVKFTVEQLQPQATMKGLSLVFEGPNAPLPDIVADKEKLRQVVNNFIDNAIKYSTTGTIRAKIFEQNGALRVEVTDTGKGMDAAVVPLLFQKYSRGKDSVTHATGIGIGLYVAKVVVENHKGQIGAESPGEGKGSTFYFTLPIKNDLPHTKVMDLVKNSNE